MNREIILITGGVKSGKSVHALQCAGSTGCRRAFIATATPGDAEMETKIARHKQERGPGWETYEEPYDPGARLRGIGAAYDCVVVDCLTMWVSNLMTLYNLDDDAVQTRFEQFVVSLSAVTARCVIVTNEVSMGLIPAESLARRYQKLLGAINRSVAAEADAVYCMIAGIAWQIK